MFVDSHTHLYLDDFGPDNTGVVERAFEAGIGHLMFPNIDVNSIKSMNELADRYPGRIDMAIGIHPTEVTESWTDDIEKIKAEAATGRYRAVGEIGMDLYWSRDHVKEQSEVFKLQCVMATELGVPVIIHCREALGEILRVFDLLPVIPRGVFHSFGGSVDDVKRVRDYGDFYFGINGIVTFKNSPLKEVLPVIGIDRILLETDSPYLAPVPMRGRRNESAYILHTAHYIAEYMNIGLSEIEQRTTSNYRTLFGVF